MILTLKQLGLVGNKMIKDKDPLASDKGKPPNYVGEVGNILTFGTSSDKWKIVKINAVGTIITLERVK